MLSVTMYDEKIAGQFEVRSEGGEILETPTGVPFVLISITKIADTVDREILATVLFWQFSSESPI